MYTLRIMRILFSSFYTKLLISIVAFISFNSSFFTLVFKFWRILNNLTKQLSILIQFFQFNYYSKMLFFPFKISSFSFYFKFFQHSYAFTLNNSVLKMGFIFCLLVLEYILYSSHLILICDKSFNSVQFKLRFKDVIRNIGARQQKLWKIFVNKYHN